jgi:FkbM family methyltransferase
MVYHSQFNQDREVERILGQIKTGYFVEAGFYDGVTESNSKHFEDLGWNGIGIEAVPHLYEKARQSRRCHVINTVLYDVDDAEVVFVDGTCVNRAGHSGVKSDLSSSLADGSGIPFSYKTKTLLSVIRECNAPKTIDFLSLDTEGSEYKILKDFPFDEYHFKVLCIEHNFKEPERSQLRELLLSKGYNLHTPDRSVGNYDDWYTNL